MGIERGWHGGGKGDTAAAGRVEMPREREVDFRVGRAPMVPGPLFLCWEEVGPLGEDRGRAGLSDSDWERPLELGTCDGGVTTCFPGLDFGPFPSLQDSHESHESLQALLITQEPVATLSQPWPWGLETEVQ